MRSPKEIRDTEFEKASRGYNIQDVDAFLSLIADEVEVLIAEKAEMQTKMMMLAEKVDQYRGDEDALRSALVSAERMKDSLLQEAQQQKEIVLRDAQQKADKLIEDAQKEIEREEITLKALRQQVAAFKSEILNIYKGHLEVLSELPEDFEGDAFDETVVATQPVMPVVETAPVQVQQPEPVVEQHPQMPVAGYEEPAVQVQPAQPVQQQAQFSFAEPEPQPAVQANPEQQPVAFFDGGAPVQQQQPAEITQEMPLAQNTGELEFATFGASVEPQPEKQESRFEKLDFGEDFTFGRD